MKRGLATEATEPRWACCGNSAAKEAARVGKACAKRYVWLQEGSGASLTIWVDRLTIVGGLAVGVFGARPPGPALAPVSTGVCTRPEQVAVAMPPSGAATDRRAVVPEAPIATTVASTVVEMPPRVVQLQVHTSRRSSSTKPP